MSQDKSIHYPKFPLGLRTLNGIGEISGKLGLRLAQLSAPAIMETACQQTRLSDWGSNTLESGLEVLLYAFKKEANLSLIGRLGVKKDLLRFLVNRLQIQDTLKRYPEILRRPITRPLFIVGYPRTGTTLLHNLFAQDLAVRVPLLWELLYPFPPPEQETRQSDPRIQLVAKRVRQLYDIMPEFRVIHPLNPTGPDECIFLFQHGLYFHIGGHIPTYVSWLKNYNMDIEYQYYRQQLHLLQSRVAADHWVLKSPFHLRHLDSLLGVFPDACIIQTHRDPQKLLPSWCSLVATMRRLYSEHVNLSQIGSSWLDIWGEMLDHALAIRAKAKPEQFCDVHYTDLVHNPLATVERIYQHFNYPFTSQIAENMHHWLQQNPQHKYGVHQYSSEHFGLARQSIAERFAVYMERFAIIQE